MNGDRAGFLPRMPARSRGRCIPIHLRVACVCSFCASVWCYVRKKMWRTHSCIDSGVIATGKTTDPLWTCVFMRGRERFFFFGFFLAGLLTIQPLSNPALPLSTYNMAAYPLAGLQTGREESADAEERPIRGRVIENTQRESTDSESRATRGRCSVCARECVCVCVEREKALMNKGLHCERDKLTLRDIWRNTFIVSPAENKYRVSRAGVQKRHCSGDLPH